MVGVGVFVTLAAMALMLGISAERMRTYGFHWNVRDGQTIVIAAGATLARGWLAWNGSGGIETSLLFAVAAAAAITDLTCGYVFDRMLTVGALGLAGLSVANGRIGDALTGGAVGALALALPWALTRARGLGFGDVKLAGVLGCGLGPYETVRALWFAFVIGAIAAIARVLTRRHSPGETLPFAPFLALGAVICAGGVL